MSRLRNLWPALALLALTLIPLQRCVIGGESIGAWDEVRAVSPWNTASSQPWDVLQADSVLQFYGWRDQVFKAWAKGHIPLWNHLELNGTPLLANSQSAALYPPHILAGVFQLPTAPAMALLAWAHLFWAGLGVYYLCRRLGGGELPAFLAAAGFGLSPFMLGWVALPSVVETVAWIPWALLGVYRIPARSGLPILAGSVAMMLLAGHLQFAAYGSMAVVVALVVRCMQERATWGKILGFGALAMFTGVLIAGPQLLPVLKYGQHSHRRNTPTKEGFGAYVAGSTPAWEFLSLPDSRLLGLPTDKLDVRGNTVNGFWPALYQRGGNFAESSVAIGPFILLLLVTGLRRKLFVSTLGVSLGGLAGLALAIGAPPLGALLYFGMPGWSATGSPGRAAVLWVLALCVMAGSLDLEREPLTPKSARDRILIYGALVVVCVGLLFRLSLSPWLPTLAAEDVQTAIPHAALAGQALGFAVIAVALGTLAFRAPKFRNLAFAVMAVLIAIFPGASLVRSSPTRLPDVPTRAGRIAILNSSWSLMQTPHALLPPNTAGLLGQHEVGGYDSIVDVRTRDNLADIDGEDPAPPENGNMMFVKKHFDPAKLADAGVSEVWSLEPLPQLGATPNPVSGIFKYPLAGPGRVSMSQGDATLVRENAEWLEIEATGPGTLTLRDHFRDGWSARIDDQLTDFTHDPWPQVALPRGRHTVRFQCWLPGLTTGFQALAVGLAIIAIYVLTSRRSTSGLKPPVVQ